MAMTPVEDMIKKLEAVVEKRDQLNARAQQLTAQISERKKKDDTRRKILAGAFLLERLERGAPVNLASMEAFMAELDQFLSRDADRVIFGLDKRATKETGAEVSEVACEA